MLPDGEFKVLKKLLRDIDEPAHFELNVPWSDNENSASPSERMISLWFGTARGTIEIVKRLGTPILVPLFPPPDLKEIASNLQLQALTRASLEDLPERFSRVDQQLIAMIDAAATPARQRRSCLS